MPPLRLSILLALIFGGTLLFLRNQSLITAARSEAVRQESRLAGLREETAALVDDLSAIQGEIEEQSRARNSAITAFSIQSRELARVDPESLWVEKPAALPDWNPESPYVWLSKELLAKLPIEPFGGGGELRAEVAAILTVDESTRREISRVAREILEEYRGLENAHVQATTNHLPGIAYVEGERHTIEVLPLPEDGARLKERLITTLHSALGEQRASLVLDRAGAWISRQFSDFAAESKIISVVRREDGSYFRAIQAAGHWSSSGGGSRLERYVPEHLIHHFEHLQATGERADLAER